MRHASLVASLAVVVCAEHTQRLQVIDLEDYTSIRRKVREMLAEDKILVSDDYLDAGIAALKQYYAVALLDPANSHAISGQLDPFWHAHILHSAQYMAFCDKVVGRYMHHIPLDTTDVRKVENVGALYGYTQKVLGILFPNHLDARFWPTAPADLKLVCTHANDYPLVNHLGLFPATPCGQEYA